MRNKKGITLIALIVTIIVLLILVGVSISVLVGDNGVINQATDASQKTKEAREKEAIELAASLARIEENSYRDLNQKRLQEEINNQFGVGQVMISDNGDGTYTASVLESKQDYIVASNSVEKGINWNEAMKDAKAPESQTRN